jgi:hypothetical protein
VYLKHFEERASRSRAHAARSCCALDGIARHAGRLRPQHKTLTHPVHLLPPPAAGALRRWRELIVLKRLVFPTETGGVHHAGCDSGEGSQKEQWHATRIQIARKHTPSRSFPSSSSNAHCGGLNKARERAGSVGDAGASQQSPVPGTTVSHHARTRAQAMAMLRVATHGYVRDRWAVNLCAWRSSPA